jgi:hypothetical protein
VGVGVGVLLGVLDDVGMPDALGLAVGVADAPRTCAVGVEDARVVAAAVTSTTWGERSSALASNPPDSAATKPASRRRRNLRRFGNLVFIPLWIPCVG